MKKIATKYGLLKPVLGLKLKNITVFIKENYHLI